MKSLDTYLKIVMEKVNFGSKTSFRLDRDAYPRPQLQRQLDLSQRPVESLHLTTRGDAFNPVTFPSGPIQLKFRSLRICTERHRRHWVSPELLVRAV